MNINRRFHGIAPVLWLAAAFGLGALWTRGQRLLGSDSFAYGEMVKQFAYDFPHQFGDWWPYGYPLSAVPLFRLGLSAHAALMAVSAAALLFTLIVLWRNLPSDSRSAGAPFLIITAAVCSPLCTQLLVFNLADQLFGAALVALAFTLGSWPSRWAVAASPVLALAAFSVRYPGIVAFAVIACFTVIRWHALRSARVTGLLGGVSLVVAVITVGLLMTNVGAWGHIAGPQPVGAESLWSWPAHLSDLGLSFIAAFSSSSRIQQWQSTYPITLMAIGFAVLVPVAALLTAAAIAPRTKHDRAVALVAAAYLLAIVTMRATTPFSPLTYPRFLFPALFLIVFLTASRAAVAQSRVAAIAAMMSLMLSVGLAYRGVSPEQAGRLEAVRNFLAATLRPGDLTSVNLPARHLAAYFDSRFEPIGGADGHELSWTVTPTNWDPVRASVTVVAARGGQGFAAIDESERRTVMAAVNAGKVRIVFESPDALVVRPR